MALKDFLGPIAAVIGTAFPPLGMAIGLANEFLPEDQKLPATATGLQVQQAVESLPPEVQAKLDEQITERLKVREDGFTARFVAMSGADGQSSRAWAIKVIVSVFAAAYAAVGVAIAYSIITGESKLVDIWPALLVYLGIPMEVIRAYFGVLGKEQSNRVAGAQNLPPVQGAVGTLMGMFKK